MPKMKSHSGAKKRFLKTASGKFKFKKAGQRHLLTPSRTKRGRQTRRPDYLNDKDGQTMRRFLPYG
ncbi:MAG: 50S ribosomal protein L35 [Elusimicrobia bacterium]|nr:50S ribosomal protein L35 [Elusimicrobiota bacterium]